MIETKIETNFTAKPVHEIIPELVRAGGPCVTLLLPPYRPGEPGDTAAALLKAELRQATQNLSARRIPETVIDELLEPLRQLAKEERFLAGSGRDRAIFRSRHVWQAIALPAPASPARACTVGDCFWIRPLLPSLALPAHVYVLEVTKRNVRLLACGLTEAVPVELPKGTPRTLDEALGFDPPDHDLMNQSSAGPSNGRMRGVQFGTGSGRETQHTYLHDFYRAVDRGIVQLLGSSDAPLILAGVDEDTAIYRSASRYSRLLDGGIHGSPSAATGEARLSRQAHDIAMFDCERRTAVEMSKSKERLGPAHFATDLDAILLAAAEGRVSRLYVDEGSLRMGNFDGKVLGGSANWHDEDLLNVAAVETLLRQGSVHSLPTHLMDGALAAAALRF